MNKGQKGQFETLAKARLVSLRNSIKSGAGRGTDAKEANCREMIELLQELNVSTTDDNLQDAARILGGVLAGSVGNPPNPPIRIVEWQRPPADGGAAQKLAAMLKDSSGVTYVNHGVTVQLDCDQLKHQHPTQPIGTRQKGGGNRFVDTCDVAWHQQNTMEHMAAWANGLGPMAPGQKVFHGQAVPVNEICYEGFCLFANGQKYVSFHCYPIDGSALLF